MTSEEFNRWLRDYTGRFPSAGKWLNSLGEEGAKVMIGHWFEAMGETTLAEAIAINVAMSTGQLEPVGSYDSDRERTAVIVKRAAKRRRDKQIVATTRPRSAYRIRRPRTKGDSRPLRQVLAGIVRLVESGRTTQEAWKELGLPPIGDEEGVRDAVKCWACRDLGRVDVWHYRSMAAWRADPGLLEYGCNRSRMCLPCSCDAGRQFVWTQEDPPPAEYKGWTEESPVYEPTRFCIAEHGDINSEHAVQEFSTWCQAFFEREQRRSFDRDREWAP